MPPRLALVALITPALTPIQLLVCAVVAAQFSRDHPDFVVTLLAAPAAIGLGVINALIVAHALFEQRPLAHFAAAAANIVAVLAAWAWTYPWFETYWK